MTYVKLTWAREAYI